MEATKGLQTRIWLQLTDGAEDQHPRAFVYDPTATEEALVDLTHIANGSYSGLWAPSLRGQYGIHFVVYSDSGHTIVNPAYDRVVESWSVSEQIAMGSAIIIDSAGQINVTVWWSFNGRVVTGQWTSVSAEVKDSAGAVVIDLGSASESGGRYAWTHSASALNPGDEYSLEVTADTEVFVVGFVREV